MRGVDVNPDQMSSAEGFITAFVTHQPAPAEEQQIIIKWGELVRLVAWYGALRARGIRDKTGGTVEKPGEFVNRSAEPSE